MTQKSFVIGLKVTDLDLLSLWCSFFSFYQEGAFEALNKQYLKSLQFGIYLDETEEPVETYTCTSGLFSPTLM